MITRRRFFSGATGVSAAIGSALFDGRSLAPVTHRDASRTEAWLPAYERKLAVSNDLDMLGIPRSWWHVHRGFHPFTPERVVIVKPQGTYRLFDSERCRKRLLEKGVILTDTRSGRNTLLREKFELILTIVEPMASAYRDGLYFEEWTLGLVSREMMGTSDVGCHLGLVHQFQKSAQPHTINGLVDWWLFLIPDGGEFDSFDGKPVHVLVGHVFSGQPIWCLGSRVWVLVTEMFRSLRASNIIALSKMDRIAAAHFLNRRLVEIL